MSGCGCFFSRPGGERVFFLACAGWGVVAGCRLAYPWFARGRGKTSVQHFAACSLAIEDGDVCKGPDGRRGRRSRCVWATTLPPGNAKLTHSEAEDYRDPSARRVDSVQQAGRHIRLVGVTRCPVFASPQVTLKKRLIGSPARSCATTRRCGTWIAGIGNPASLRPEGRGGERVCLVSWQPLLRGASR